MPEPPFDCPECDAPAEITYQVELSARERELLLEALRCVRGSWAPPGFDISSEIDALIARLS